MSKTNANSQEGSQIQKETGDDAHSLKSSASISSVRSSYSVESAKQKRSSSLVANMQSPSKNSRESSFLLKRDRLNSVNSPPRLNHSTSVAPSSVNSKYSLNSPSRLSPVVSSRVTPTMRRTGVSSSSTPILKRKESTTSSTTSFSLPEDPLASLPVIPPELQIQLDSNELVQLTEQPVRDRISTSVKSLQELKELCEKTAVMKVHSPEIKMKDRIAEIDAIVDNANAVLQRVLIIRNECIMACNKVERQFIQYNACVEHNTQILRNEEGHLKEQQNEQVNTVSELNTHNMQLKEQDSALTTQVVLWDECNT